MVATNISSENGGVIRDHGGHRDRGEHVHELALGALPGALHSWSMDDSGEAIQSDEMDNHYVVIVAIRHNT